MEKMEPKRKTFISNVTWKLFYGAAFFITFGSIVCTSSAIRVYEGTKSQETTKTPSLDKFNARDSLQTISKRSWESLGENLERESEKWREVDRRSTTVSNDRILRMSKETKALPNLYKIKLTQHGYIQYLKYLVQVPALQEYTFCLWFTSSNLTNSHPLFSYSLNEKQRLIGFWFNPSESTLQMGIRDEIVFKVPVTIREHRWYHVCQSWHGLHGEWAVFVDNKKKGNGILPKYRATYIPGGGEIGVGQELTDVDKGLDDGIEGEIFGFNLVDESVDFNGRRRPPPSPPPSSTDSKVFIPPFKSLPPVKKTFDEIKAYISTLPAQSPEPREVEQTLTDVAEEPNAIKTDDSLRYVRNKLRTKYHAPVRKVVIYNRHDRQLKDDEFGNTLPLKRSDESKSLNQLYDENYSIHSYKPSRESQKSTRYEIYEVSEEDGTILRPKDDVDLKIQRKTRNNFDLYTAREANRMYPLSSRNIDPERLKYHFQTSEPKKTAEKRSLDLDSVVKRNIGEFDPLPEAIPVYEVVEEDVVGHSRRKRNAKRGPRHIDEGTAAANTPETGFKRLPDIPLDFINIFAKEAPKDQLQGTLDRYFYNSTSEPNGSLEDPLGRRRPQNFPNPQELEKMSLYEEPLLSKSHQFVPENRRRLTIPPKTQPSFDKKSFIPTTGTELVLRSYMSCGLDRGSPVTDKNHLIVSWADTPVRIYGGAMVSNAKNSCGRF